MIHSSPHTNINQFKQLTIMKAYYIHWNYPSSADDALYYAGKDDNHFFHHKENAEKFAEDKLVEIKDKVKKGEELIEKGYNEGLTDEEDKQLDELYNYVYSDNPESYRIYEREIVFEDEE